MHRVTLHCGRYGTEVQSNSLRRDESKSWVVISLGVARHVTEVSTGCKQSMYPETVAQQDASLSTEQSAADVAFCNRIKKQKHHLRDVRNRTVLQ